MSEGNLKALQKKVRKTKRIASEAAMALHDLVEDELPAGYPRLPQLAQATYEACQAWDEARVALEQAEQEMAS